MATAEILYPSDSTQSVTITSLNSLASNSSQGVFTTCCESNAINNTSTLDLDHLLSGTIVMGGTAPTVNRNIVVFVVGPSSMSNGTPSWPDVFDGTDSTESVTSQNVMDAIAIPVATIYVDAVASRSYSFGPVSVANAFGGALPPYYVVVVAQDTGQSLASSGHSIQYFRIKRSVT